MASRTAAITWERRAAASAALLRGVRAVDRRLPGLTYNPGKSRRLAELTRLLAATPGPKEVLVIGAGTAGPPIDDPRIHCVLTDIRELPGVDVVCDAHDLPFEAGTFDAVIAVAVLHHVVDPTVVVEEIRRVLKPGGLAYSEIPFLQRVHAGAWDFTRYTMLGHRRLFRWFDTLILEPVAGPASSLAWALSGVTIAALARNRATWYAANRLSLVLFGWIPQLDRFLLTAPAASDSACGTAFLGRKRDSPVDDATIVSSYRGACPTPRVTPVPQPVISRGRSRSAEQSFTR